MRSVVVFLFLAVALTFPGSAQINQTPVTRTTLTVYVQLSSNDRALPDGIEARLLGRGEILVAEAFTDERGRVEFRDIPEGFYHVMVRGTGIETTTGSEFEVIENSASQTEFVRVKPAMDANTEHGSAPGAPPTVSASELSIPPKAQKEFDKGVDAFSSGDNKKAEDSFKKAIESYPNYADAYSNLGVLYIKTGQQQKAKDAFTRAVTVDNKFVPGYVNLARLSFADHKYPETERTLGKALAINPDNLDALALLATTEYMNKENEKALAHIRHIHSLPGHEAVSGVHLVAAEILMAENERDQAIDQYLAFLHESPNDLRVPAVRKTLAQMKASQQ
jgi:tetratricopeptide (TPR) repeat protein